MTLRAAARESCVALNADFSAAIRLGHRRRAPRRLSRKKCNLARGNQPSIGEIFESKSTRAACFNEPTPNIALPCLSGYNTVQTLFPRGKIPHSEKK